MTSELVTIDFESYYGTRCDIKSLGVSQYVAHPDFEILCMGFQTKSMTDARVIRGRQVHEFFDRLKQLQKGGSTIILSGHNLYFDGYVASYHYGFVPDYYLCTYAMAQPLHAPYMPTDLDTLSRHYGYEGKVPDVLADWRNRRWADATPEQRRELIHYCGVDVTRSQELLYKMIKEIPRSELDIIDLTLRLFNDPMCEADADLAREIIEEEQEKKTAALKAAGVDDKKRVTSDKQFAELLDERGFEVPMKWSIKQEKEIPALAKADLPFQKMQNSDDPELRKLIDARLANKSSINETRAEAFIKRADQPVPIYLGYCGAHTMRFCMPGHAEVLTPEGWVRMDSWEGQRIAQWNPDNKKTSWVQPPSMNHFPYEGELLTLHSRHVRGAFTPEHRLARYTSKRAFKNEEIKELEGKHLRLAVPTAIPGGKYVSDDLVRLIAATSADGCLGNAGTLQFTFRKERKLERLYEILYGLRIESTEYTVASGLEKRIYIPRRQLPIPIEQLKYPTVEEIMSWSLKARKLFIEELRYWDGNSNRPQLYVSTTDRTFVDLISAVGASIGYTSNIYEEDRSKTPNHANKFDVGFRCHSYVGATKKSWGRKLFKGDVYCPTTETGFFVVRYEGQIHVTGNSGGDKFNPQNMPREGRLRRCLKAPKGYKFVIVDASQIEARDNATFSGQKDLMDEFAAGVDVYASFASDIYGFEVDKTEYPNERFVGKTGILGLGFQCGAWKFMNMLQAGMMGPPIDIEAQEAQRVVDTYRQKYFRIKNTWRELQNMISTMLPGNHQPVEFRGLVFKPGGRLLMPNGLHLHYPGLDFDVGEWGTAEFSYRPWKAKYKKFVTEKLYGGLLLENIIQCRARIMTCGHMMELARFYRVVMMAHDEIVMCVPNKKAKGCLKDALEIMSIPPRWNENCPLAAEGIITQEYQK